MNFKIAPVLIVLVTLLASHVNAQWTACSPWGRSVPVVTMKGTAQLHIPGNYDAGGPLVAFCTTTNLAGDLRHKSLTITIWFTATDDVRLYWGNDTGTGERYAAARLYFTTVPGPYDYRHGMLVPDEYWWSTQEIALSDGKFGRALTGEYTLTVAVAPDGWSNALGGLGESRVEAFRSAAKRVAQVGLAFGGGSFYDVGIGNWNPETRTGSADMSIYDCHAWLQNSKL